MGSIEELPGKTCAEIKASEGQAINGTHWIYADEGLEQAIQATCEGNLLALYWSLTYSNYAVDQIYTYVVIAIRILNDYRYTDIEWLANSFVRSI